LRDDLKFTELVATTLGSLREVRLLERSQTSLRQFFSPVVTEALAGHDPDEVLAPRETEVSVLFCDLRGFARQSEQAADDLLGLLHRVSDALGVTTHHILDQGGVVGDFHGDAAMGFWGWPFAREDADVRACRAALDIRAAFESASQDENLPLADFSIGIGVATGRAVAGKIGTVDQVKVTVFGPVVNLAARLEGMTKLLRAPILLDETTAQQVRASMSRDEARVRRVAVVKPLGFDAALEVSELLPPQSDFPALSDDDIAAYEAALEALLAGNWEQAFQLLHNVPAEDRVKDFLTVFIAQHNRTPPDDWDGVIPLTSK
jgi:adenylate cyclase